MNAIQIIEEIKSQDKVVSMNIDASLAFEVVSNLKDEKFKVSVNGAEISSENTRLEVNLFLLKHSVSMSQYSDISESIARQLVLKSVLESVESVVAEFITPNMPLVNYYHSFSIEDSITFLINEIINFKSAIISSHISVQPSNNIRVVEANYDDLAEKLVDREGIFVINAEMGHGKTEKVTKPVFEMACEKDLFPIGVAPKKVLAHAIISDDRNYKNINKESNAKGVFGVVNSIFTMDKFETFRTNSQVLIAEEHEEIVEQCSGRAVGTGCITDRADLLAAYYEAIKNTKTVILVDAMFSQNEAQRIVDLTGRNITVITPKASANHTKPVITFTSEAENVAVAIKNLKAGKKVVSFSDAANKAEKSKFNEIFHAVSGFSTSSQVVTAATVAAQEDSQNYIKNISADLESFQYNQISPVISSGVSITSEEFSNVNLFANQTISIKTAIQTIRRFRKASEVTVSVASSFVKKPLSKKIIVGREMIESFTSEEMTDAAFDELMNSQSVDLVAQSIINSNLIDSDYEVNMILALRQLGFEVRFSTNEQRKEAGKEAKKIGREVEKEIRVEALVMARHIDSTEYQQISDDSEKSDAIKAEIASYEMRNFYEEVSVTRELVEFDKKGETRNKIRNIAIAMADDRMIKNQSNIAKKIVTNALFSTLNMTSDFACEFTTADAEKFARAMKKTYKIGEMKTNNIFELAFGDKLETRHAVSTVTRILSSKFGIKLESTQKRVNGERVRVYSSQANCVDSAIIGYAQKMLKKM